MQSIFLRIYIGMLFAAALVAALMFVLSMQINEQRMKDYVERTSVGFFNLLANNLAGKKETEQRQWLQSIERLNGITINLIDKQAQLFSEYEQSELAKGNLVSFADIEKREVKVFYAISINDKHLLAMHLKDFNEQLARAAALLLVNELERFDYDQDERFAVFQLLKNHFDFPMRLLRQDSIYLDATQSRILQRGEMVVTVDENSFDVPSIRVLAPTDVRDEVLIIGPIPVFDWTPQTLIVLSVFLGGLLFGLCVYFLLQPLQRRLNRMGHEIEQIDLSEDTQPMTVESKDMLGLFSIKVNVMAHRIKTLMSAQRELTQAVSHELRTPIARMKFHLALMDGLLEETAKKHLQGIQSDTRELERLVDEILTYASLEQGQPQLQVIEMDLLGDVSRLVSEIASIRPEVMIEVQEGESFYCEADAHYIMRACQNLIINAQRHAHSQVRVHVYINEDRYCVSVHDDGEGILDTQKEDIFTPFKRLDDSRNRQSGGYGLGLAIVKEIMRWHQGSVKVSDSDLGGCEFLLQWDRGLKITTNNH